MKQNLKTTVTNITLERVTEEQALQWVNKNFGEFCTYIVNRKLDDLGITKKEVFKPTIINNSVRAAKEKLKERKYIRKPKTES